MSLLHDNLLAFVFLVSMVELEDLADNPECLSIELLFQVRLKEVHESILVAQGAVGQDIA